MTPTPGINYYTPRQWLSVSALCSYARCPRLFFYSSGCRLVESIEHPALNFGEAIHYAVPVVTMEGLEKGIEAFDKAWIPVEGDDKRNRLIASKMLKNWAETHCNGKGPYELLKPPPGTIEVKDRVSDWEIPFAFAVPGLPIPIVGRIDGLARHRATGALYGLEYKTSSELSARLFTQFDLCPQVIIYTIALRVLTQQKVDGIFLETLHVAKTDQSCMSQPMYVSDRECSDMLEWISWTGNKILEHERLGWWPKQRSGCAPYAMFGSPGYQCKYFNLCNVPDWTTVKDLYRQKDEKVFTLPVEGDSK